MKTTHREYNDLAPRNGSTEPDLTLTEKIALGVFGTVLMVSIIGLIGSFIWGSEGFVDLLASFIA